MPVLDGHALTTMLVVFAVVGLLVVALRWTFGGSSVRNPPRPGPADDYGLLTPVAVVESGEEARRLRALLADAGIRATWTIGSDGRYRVLVFASEVDRARNIAGWST